MPHLPRPPHVHPHRPSVGQGVGLALVEARRPFEAVKTFQQGGADGVDLSLQ